MIYMTGFFLILLRTGDYDADMFTKILGWILFAPSLVILMYYYKWTGLTTLSFGSFLIILLKNILKEVVNEYSY